MFHKNYTDNPSFEGASGFMSDEAMLEYISNRPIVNSDIVFVQKDKQAVFHPTRRAKPAEGPWFVGGGRRAFESAIDTALRRLSKETSLEGVSADDLEYVGQIEYIWSYRKEAPTDHGRHDINDIFALEVTDEQVAQIGANLDETEYVAEDGLKMYTFRQALEVANARQLLLDVYNEIY